MVFAAAFAVTLHVVKLRPSSGGRRTFARLLRDSRKFAACRRGLHRSACRHRDFPRLKLRRSLQRRRQLHRPTPLSTIPVQPRDRLWLGPLNRYRESTGLAPVTANPRFSHGDYLHSLYVVKNFAKRLTARENLGAEMHFEDPSKTLVQRLTVAAAGPRRRRRRDVESAWTGLSIMGYRQLDAVAVPPPAYPQSTSAQRRLWLLLRGFGVYCRTQPQRRP